VDVRAERRDGVTTAERAYFVAVGILAAWVGFPAYFLPKHVTKVLPFSVPPLHARFIGAIYISGFVLQVGGLLARRWTSIRVVPLITAIWTGGLMIITFLHHDDFDFTKTQTQVWTAAYVAYPLLGIAILISRRNDALEEPGASAAGWVRRILVVQGVALSALGLALLLAPGPMADGWPWPITDLLAQIYSAPFLAYGVGSLVLARSRSRMEIRLGVTAIGLFACGALVASLIHRELFAGDDVAAWAWFAALAVVSGSAVAMVASSRAAS
jgi:hypothetical protein